MKKVYLGKTRINDTYVGRHRAEITSLSPIVADYAIVGGGGGGSIGQGAGGGGEVKTNFFGNNPIVLIPSINYSIEIGQGGSGSVYFPGVNDGGQNGYPSYISSSKQGYLAYAVGGGGGSLQVAPFSTTITGGPYNLTGSAAKDGGSAGGGNFTPAKSTASDGGYGNDAGSGSEFMGGGAGGALTTGSNAFSVVIGANERLTRAPNGGEPVIIEWIPFNNGELGAGGGGGAQYQGEGGPLPSVTTGSAGFGGGTTGGNGGVAIERPQPISLATSGSANTGAGGGGGGTIASDVQGRFYQEVSGWGGSGFCAIRYISDTPMWTGGEISGSDGYVYHFFTASAEMSYVQS